MRSAAAAVVVIAVLVFLTTASGQSPVKPPDKIRDPTVVQGELAAIMAAPQLAALREQIKKEVIADMKDRAEALEKARKAGADESRRVYEAEIASLRKQVSQVSQISPAKNVTVVGPSGSFRVVGLVVQGDGKGSVALAMGKDKKTARTLRTGDPFYIGDVMYRVEEVTTRGAILTVTQRLIIN